MAISSSPPPLDPSLVGRTFPATAPYRVTHEAVAAFAATTGADYSGGPAPATFPIVLAFDAIQVFLDSEGIELSRIVHGEQRFHYERPVVPGDELTARLTVTGLRHIGGADIIATSSELTDPDGTTVCRATATLVHRGEAA